MRPGQITIHHKGQFPFRFVPPLPIVPNRQGRDKPVASPSQPATGKRGALMAPLWPGLSAFSLGHLVEPRPRAHFFPCAPFPSLVTRGGSSRFAVMAASAIPRHYGLTLPGTGGPGLSLAFFPLSDTRDSPGPLKLPAGRANQSAANPDRLTPDSCRAAIRPWIANRGSFTASASQNVAGREIPSTPQLVKTLNITEIIAGYERDIGRDRAEIKRMCESAELAGRSNLSAVEDQRAETLMAAIERNQASLARAKVIKAEEDEQESRLTETHKVTPASRSIAAYDDVIRIGSEPRTYSRDKDPEGTGVHFLNDVVAAFRGNPSANERLARHQRETEVDNPKRKERAAGDVTTGAFPNLVIPQFLVDQYAAKPTAARPFADVCRHIDLPAEGMKVELAKGNTTSTAALQATELVAPAGGNFDADPLELLVQTAEAWQLVSRQSIERGRVTEQIVVNDMLDQMNALVDSTLLTQTTTGLYDSGTRITYDSASPTFAELYPLILQGASKVSQTLLNRGQPTHVLMHPRRWYFLSSLVASTWPQVNQPGVPVQSMGVSTGNAYNDGVAGVLPCGLKVIMDANVQTAALAGAQTGGTQDVLYVVAQNECILLEAPNREVYIRAEAPAAPQLGVMLVAYEYFAYTFSRYPATAVQRINGTGTVPGSF
jgi:hypothetical protein